MTHFLAHTLFLLAAWTLTIKFAFPAAFALSEGVPLGAYVYWDFWWAAHLWLGWALLNRPPYTRALGLGMAVVEIVIVTVKFVHFLSDPQWTVWQTNWFINKLFVLACFVLILVHFTAGRGRAEVPRRRGSS